MKALTSSTIDGVKYSAWPMDPYFLCEDAGKLTHILKTSVNEALASGASADDPMMLARAGFALVSQLRTKEALDVIERLFSYADAEGTKLEAKGWRMHFTGRAGALPQVISWLIKEQFGDFFDGARSSLTGLAGSLGARTASQRTPSEPLPD